MEESILLSGGPFEVGRLGALFGIFQIMAAGFAHEAPLGDILLVSGGMHRMILNNRVFQYSEGVIAETASEAREP